jgi:hypothetical protein
MASYLFLTFSEFLKTRFRLEAKTRIPVGAGFLVWIGEILNFIVSTIKYFSG